MDFELPIQDLNSSFRIGKDEGEDDDGNLRTAKICSQQVHCSRKHGFTKVSALSRQQIL